METQGTTNVKSLDPSETQPACCVSHRSSMSAAGGTVPVATRAANAQAGISKKNAQWCEVRDSEISIQGKEMM